MYSLQARHKVRDAFLLGRGSLSALAEENGIRKGTVLSWAAKERWQELREQIESEAVQMRTDSLVAEVAKVNGKLLETWGVFLDRVRARLQDDHAEPMSAADLDALSRVVARLQGGQRTALNAEVSGENETREIKIVYTSLREHLMAEFPGETETPDEAPETEGLRHE